MLGSLGDPELPPLPDFSAPDKAGRSEDGLSRFDGCCSLVCLLAPPCMDCWQVTMLCTAWRTTTQLLISPWHCRLPGRNAHMCCDCRFPSAGLRRWTRPCASSSPPLCPRCVAAPVVGDSDPQDFSAGQCSCSCGRDHQAPHAVNQDHFSHHCSSAAHAHRVGPNLLLLLQLC